MQVWNTCNIKEFTMSKVIPLFKTPNPTRVIVIEGVDGVGKATQTALLCKALEDKGFSVADFSFPMYDMPWGKVIKKMLSNEPCVTPHGTYLHPDYFNGNPYIKSMLYLNNFAESYHIPAGISSVISGTYKKDFIIFDRYVSSMIAFAYAGCVLQNKDSTYNRVDWKKVMEFINFNFLGVKIDLQINLIADLSTTKKNLETRYEGKTVVDVHEQNEELMHIVGELYRLNYNFAFETPSPVPIVKEKPEPKPFFSAIYNKDSFIEVINCINHKGSLGSKEEIALAVKDSVFNYFQIK